MLDLVEIGEQVKAARLDKKMSQRDVAEKARVSRTVYQQLENGRAADMGFMNVQRICSVVGLDLSLKKVRPGQRPTLQDLQREAEEELNDDAPGVG